MFMLSFLSTYISLIVKHGIHLHKDLCTIKENLFKVRLYNKFMGPFSLTNQENNLNALGINCTVKLGKATSIAMQLQFLNAFYTINM